MRTRNGKLIRLAVALCCALATGGCGFNLLYYVTPGKDDPATLLEDAKILLDKRDYSGAAELLSDMKNSSSKDSNDVRLLLAAANLGISGLDVWSIIGTLLESSSSKSGGVNSILNSISDEVIGEGDEKAAKLAALEEAVDDLQSAPNPEDDRIENTACFLAGILVVPTITDATTALTNFQSAIDSVRNGDCDGAAGLSDAVGDISESAVRFSLVLDTAKSCPFLKLDTTSVEGVNGALNTLIAGADKGCSSIPTGMEQLLPACVQSAAGIPNTSAAASDKRIDSCEIVLHCYDPKSCFK